MAHMEYLMVTRNVEAKVSFPPIVPNISFTNFQLRTSCSCANDKTYWKITENVEHTYCVPQEYIENGNRYDECREAECDVNGVTKCNDVTKTILRPLGSPLNVCTPST
jgi:hypothetical protein